MLKIGEHVMYSKINRLSDNPILRPDMDNRMGNNLNGPSLIRVPDWVDNPLGTYYLYFGHHDGRYIRLAYADDVAGPWQTHTFGSLQLSESLFKGHIASPDVHVDNDASQIRMYFHGSDSETGGGGEQSTRLAVSTDGLNFRTNPQQLGNPYWRVFQWGDYYYAISMPGVIYRSLDGISGFEKGPNPFDANMRHSAVIVDGDELLVYFTTIGDSAERIKRSTIKLSPDWLEWSVSEPQEILRPEFDWEGASEPEVPSSRGLVHGPVNQLRDPAIFVDNDRTYLLYSVAGENGIAIAELD